MKLWLLRPIKTGEWGPWYPWYDKCFGAVVAAESEEQARQLLSAEAGDEQRQQANAWLSWEYSSCVELVPSGLAGVIIKDFWSA